MTKLSSEYNLSCLADQRDIVKWLLISVACKGGQTRRRHRAAMIGGIRRVKLQKLRFIKLLKIYAVSYRMSTNTCFMDLIESCLGHGVIMLSRKSSAISAFVLKLLFRKFQLVCYVIHELLVASQ